MLLRRRRGRTRRKGQNKTNKAGSTKTSGTENTLFAPRRVLSSRRVLGALGSGLGSELSASFPPSPPYARPSFPPPLPVFRHLYRQPHSINDASVVVAANRRTSLMPFSREHGQSRSKSPAVKACVPQPGSTLESPLVAMARKTRTAIYKYECGRRGRFIELAPAKRLTSHRWGSPTLVSEAASIDLPILKQKTQKKYIFIYILYTLFIQD